MGKKTIVQLLNHGQKFDVDGETFEVIGVSFNDGTGSAKAGFFYEIQLTSEAQERRDIEAKRAEEARKASDEQAKKEAAELVAPADN